MASIIEEISLPEKSATTLDRIKYLRHVSRKTQAQFAKLINIDPSSMSKVLAGKMPITEAFLNRVVVNLNVSKDWLVDGVGVPFEKNEALRVINPEDSMTLTDVDVPKGAAIYDIDATAGCIPLSQLFTRENVIGYIDMPTLDTSNPVVKVTGDSMAPRILNGSFISIRPIRDPSVILWGSPYVVEMEDYRMVKILKPDREDPANIILHSENPDYDDIHVKRASILRYFLVEAVLNYQLI